MKLSKKLKKKLKKRLLMSMSSITACLVLLAGCKLAGVSASFESLKAGIASSITGGTSEIALVSEEDSSTTSSVSEELRIVTASVSQTVSSSSRLANTDTITYIYDAQDLCDFRDSVNAGDTYEGKTVYLMDDIDLSTVCGSSVDTDGDGTGDTAVSWVPIGATGTYFTGTFDGNYHTISNLYYNGATYANIGLFANLNSASIVENIIMENIYIYSTYTTDIQYIGGIVGYNTATIQNCGINSGSITAYRTTGTNSVTVGGIAGLNTSSGIINGCYNKANISGTANYYGSSGVTAWVGGIFGDGEGKALNCYNTGTIYAHAYVIRSGGIIGRMYRSTAAVKNCYNIGSITGSGKSETWLGGIAGLNGTTTTTYGTYSNNYCLTNVNYSYRRRNSSTTATTLTTGKVSSDTLKTYVVTLGSSYAYDVYNTNSGYPVLAWQNERPSLNLNVGQEYINVGETVNLSVSGDEESQEIFSNDFSNSKFTWTSTNEDVATVNTSGVVTGVSDGYTTIYAYNEENDMYAMAVINVASVKANPQVETGNGFTATLRANGTVWVAGNNTNGTLGNGTNENSNFPVQVMIDEDTALENVVKISSGTDHILALTESGNVYAWGLNTYGQLGQNNTTSYNYAKIVLGTDGSSLLSHIVDISAGSYGSAAIDESGNVYVWGKGDNGELGDSSITESDYPVNIQGCGKAISIQVGGQSIKVLASDGIVYSWGRNYAGQNGVNSKENYDYPMKAALNVTEVSMGGYHTVIRKVDDKVYVTGNADSGRLGIDTEDNVTEFTEISLPDSVSDTNKIKYIKAGIINTTILLEDGTVWETGLNLQGELGNGTTTTQTTFVQGQTESGNLENVLIIGRNNGNVSGSTTTGYGLNTAVIVENGDVYVTGDNTYGQIGNYSTTSSLYYTKMEGESYLEYGDSSIMISSNEQYTIDRTKLNYICQTFNVYTEESYEVNELSFESADTDIATVDNNGVVTGMEVSTGITKIKIIDVTNGFECYFTVIVNKMQDTDSLMYIYSADDMARFRDLVNAGDDFAGKTVYVMADIDMSSVCSTTVGSWEPIGATGTTFAGTFDGNYHTISNLYYNGATYANVGFFTNLTSTAIIKNLIMKNIDIYNSYASTKNSYTGGIVGNNTATIQNCGIDSGNIITYCNNSNDYCAGSGGIAGHNSASGVINGCYNNASISTTVKNTTAWSGGIFGDGEGKALNCYNTGTIYSKGYYIRSGGIIGRMYRKTASAVNCYNVGSITGSGTSETWLGGIAGLNGTTTTTYGTYSNNYCLTNVNYSYRRRNSSITATTFTVGRVSSDTLKTYSTTLGSAFVDDDFNINEGYPILWWQAPTAELNVKQEYINVGESLQLKIDKTSSLNGIGIDLDITDYEWSSENEDVATVDANALVTGILDGTTTIYGYNSEYDIYVMAVINVAKNTVTPQTESGEGFTVMLKSDGTVWAVGKNENGELGDGTLEDKNKAVQVKIDANTYLQNVVKISSGTNFALALTQDGNVYAWGLNTYGQLGQNNTESSNYAVKVLGEGGSSYLSNIKDISCGSYGALALNEYGEIYVWGNGSYGELANNGTSSSSTPVKTTLQVGISVSSGAGHNAVLGQNGKIYSWGRNNIGQLGIGNTTNQTTVGVSAETALQISASGYSTVYKDVNGDIYGTGQNVNGQLSTGSTTNLSTFTKMTVTSIEGEIKYIKTGRTSTTILTKDGNVYISGTINGELTSSTTFAEAIEKSSGTQLTGIIMIGRSNGESKSLVSATIKENGRIYIMGDNTYGELGNNSNDDEVEYVPMGYLIVDCPDQVKLEVNESKNIEINYTETYFNVIAEDKIEENLLDKVSTANDDIASYSNGLVFGRKIGNTMLVLNDENLKLAVYIPVRVTSEGGEYTADVNSGDSFTVTLKADGTIWTFGSNNNGELGLGDATSRNIPEEVIIYNEDESSSEEDSAENTKVKFEQISVGTNHIVALSEDGKVYTWGKNANGELGNGTKVSASSPQEVELTLSEDEVIKEKVVKVIANKNTTYAITNLENVYVWGYGYTTSPTLLVPEDTIIEITSNYYLTPDGTVKKIANSTEVELSYNEYEAYEDPVTVEEKIVEISEGTDHLLMLGESGIVYSYGTNTYGQLGDGTTVSRNSYISTAVRISEDEKLSNIVKISAGDKYNIAQDKNGKIYLWGKNEKGELGENPDVSTGGIQETLYAITNEALENVVNVANGVTHTAVSNSTGEVYTFGSGTSGELGNCENTDYYEPQLVGKNIITSNTNEIVMEVGSTFNVESEIDYFNLYNDVEYSLSNTSLDETIATVDSNGLVTGTGEGRTSIIVSEVGSQKIGVIQARILASGTVPESNETEIEPQVATGGSHTVTLRVDGTVWCYGDNKYGQLGTGVVSTDVTNIDIPVEAVFPDGTEIVKISAGEEHSIALDSDGNVWVWGRNQYYQLGNSTDEYLAIPTKLTGLPKIKDITAGVYNTFAVTETGEVYGCGLNANGECGIGSYTSKITITKAKYLTDIIDIKAGKNHTIALKSTGEVYVTGSNLYGELGNGAYSIRKQYMFKKVDSVSNIVGIGAGNSNNLAINTNGNMYSWGCNIYGELGITSTDSSVATPTLTSLTDIREVEGGKDTAVAVDGTQNVYVTGLNKYGQLGNNTKTDINTFQTLSTISDVIDISTGNGYTVYLKQDGTVWANGDYTHGSTTLKSKTNSVIPVQVGNDETGFTENEILVKVAGTKDLLSELESAFNLIYIDEDVKEKLSYESLNSDIATVENGVVTGVSTGTTWAKITNIETSKVYVVKVNVVEEEYVSSPKVEGGENFAVVLKGNGNIYSFGYNSDGQLGDGTNITRDVPTATNIITTYKDIAVGDDFYIALRDDNTVWATGNNDYGQLGQGTTKSQNALVQINGITDIEKIAVGKNYAVFLDSYGLVYGSGANSEGQLGSENVGANTLSPVLVGTINEKIIDIFAGDSQTILLARSGKIYGMGNILNGYLNGIENVVKVEVGDGYLLILTSDNKVYKYDGTALTDIGMENVIDISVTGTTENYQTTQDTEVYTICAGYNNKYIIKNTGFVYALGDNEYGQLGNSTRNASDDYTLVGDREFEVLPTTKIMTVNDVEYPEIKSDTFNVFEEKTKDASEYTWESDDVDVVYATSGKLTAYNEGTAVITVTDNVTGESLEIERYVQELDKQRISEISVNNTEASPDGYDADDADVMTYKVKVETDDTKGTLFVKTKDSTDLISLDKEDWETNVGEGSLTIKVDLPTKTTEIPVYVKTENGTILKYILTVEKISKDVGIKKITVTSGADLTNPNEIIEAKPVSTTRYEVAVSEDTTVSLTDVITNSEYAYVSIDGNSYNLNEQTKNLVIGNNLTKEVSIVIKAENGSEQEYTLVIYKESELAKLEELKVNDESATKVSEGKYAITLDSSITSGEVYAKAVSSLVNVSIENNTYAVLENTNTISFENNPQEVSVKLQLPDGTIKEYTLEIYSEESSDESAENQLDMVIVNGSVVSADDDGSYRVYLPSAETSATVKAIAKYASSLVQIASNDAETGESEVDLAITANENKYTIKVTSEAGDEKEYTLYIYKAEASTLLSKVYVQNGTYSKQATQQDSTTYEVKVPNTYKDFDVTAMTSYINAKVKIIWTDADGNSVQGEYSAHSATENITLSTESDTTQVTIKVQSEDGTIETEYTLNIIKLSSNTDLESVFVESIEAVWDDDKNCYTAQLTGAITKAEVKAITVSADAKVKIDTNSYETNITTQDVTIDSKTTTVTIQVQAEDGTTKTYELVIEGLSDNTNIQKVVVNGKTAVYKDGENKYEIRLDAQEYSIDVIPEDTLAKVKLGDEEQVIGTASTTVTKSGDETIVKVVVTSQNGLETEEYEIVIKEISDDATIGSVYVNGKVATKLLDGNYTAEVSGSTEEAVIKAIANDSFGVAYLDDETQSTNTVVVTKNITERETVYTIKVVAENGDSEEHTLTITRLSNDTSLSEVKVTYNQDVTDDETGVTTSTGIENVLIQKDDESYYLKIPRIDKVTVNAIMQDTNANVKINNSAYAVYEIEQEIETVAEITTVTITAKAEDGTTKTYKLILEKMSNDTGITYDSESKIKVDGYTMYVDESLEQIELIVKTVNENASLKLSSDTEYTLKTITLTVDLSDLTKESRESYGEGWFVDIDVIAEDGETATYTIAILKTGNTELSRVKVNEEEIENKKDTYTARVNVAATASTEIKSDNENATIQIIKQETDASTGEITETTIASGTGTLSTNVDLTNNPEEYVIRVISANGSTTKDYSLIIEQKSTETGISYVKVDNVNALETDDGYKISIYGKDKYQTIIKLTDEKAKVKISYGDYTSEWYTGKLIEDIPILDGETLEVTITVQAENGNEETYTLSIKRVSSNVKIDTITVEDLVDGTQTPVEVTQYNESTKTYSIIVNKELVLSNVVVTANSELSTVTLDETVKGTGTANIDKSLTGVGKVTVRINVLAADGETTENYYLNIIQLSDEIGLAQVKVDGVEITANDVGDYETTITDENETATIYAKTTAETSKVAINSSESQILESTYKLTKDGSRKYEIPIQVTAEDETTYTYTLTINVISHNSSTDYVKVNDAETSSYTNTETNIKTYKAFIDAYETTTNISIKAQSSYATVEYEGQSDQETLAFDYDTSDLSKNEFVITYKITAEDGTQIEYQIQLVRNSTENGIEEIYVDGTLITAKDDGTYYAQISENAETVLVKVLANNEYATVTFAETSKLQTLEKSVEIDQGNKITTVTIQIKSQQGDTNTKILTLERVSSDATLQYVEVESDEAEVDETGKIYTSYIYDVTEQVTVNIGSNNEYANVQQVSVDENGEIIIIREMTNKLVFDTTTADQTTTVYFRIVSEDGTQTTDIYTLNIEKLSTDTTLKEVYVNGTLIEPDEDGKYLAKILDTAGNPTVKVATNSEHAHVRIALEDESVQTAEKQIELSSEKQTIVPVTVRSQSGVTKVTNVYIEVISTTVKLDTVTVEDKEADNYTESTHTYEFIVNKDLEEYELFATTLSQYANITYEGDDYGSSIRTTIPLESTLEGKEITLKVTSENGLEQEYTIMLIRESTDNSLEYLKVDTVERTPEEDGKTYKVMIGKLQEQATIEVQTTLKYANIQIADFGTVKNTEKATIDCDLTQDKIIVPIVVTAPDGETAETYNVMLIRGSNDTSIELKANGTVIEQDDDGNYKTNVVSTSKTVTISATMLGESVMGGDARKVDINLTGEYEYPTKTVELTNTDLEGKETITIPIVVIAEDGTTRENVLTLTVIYPTSITGQILTDNTEGKHSSTITVYKTKDATKEVVTQVQTEEDGTFEAMIYATGVSEFIDTDSNGIADVLECEYDIVVSKDGYLDYTVTNISLIEQENSDIGTYQLIAGDVVQSGEIEISDLVYMNDNISSAADTNCDLNEDGAINDLDRNILKTNYGKVAETEEWVNPNAVSEASIMTMSLEDEEETSDEMLNSETLSDTTEETSIVESEETEFILPISCTYTITSEYGYRIHPTTGENKKHTGIDLQGEWHTPILAVADGEVVDAGVSSAWGNYIEIKHEINGQTLYSFYAHLSQIDVTVGQTVAQGEQIGLEGGAESDPNHGNSTGHHLHFEIRTASGYGNDVDPSEYIEF